MRLYTRKQCEKTYLYVDFTFNEKRYRRPLKLEDTPKNRKLAKTKLMPEIQYKLNSGEFFKNEKQIPTVDEFAKTSFEIHKNERREITQKRYLRLYHLHIEPYFKNRRMDTIKPSELAKWQNQLLEKVVGKTVKGVRTIFNTFFEDALKDELLEKNPFALIKAPNSEVKLHKNPFSVSEIFNILDAAPDKMRAFFAIGFFTGMRTGEIIGLKWEDINFHEATIRVERSRRQGIETLPKTKNSIRTIDIIDTLFPYLQKHRKLSREDSIYVFETYLEEPFNTCDKISSHYWKKTLKQLGISYRNLYQMRHTFASLMLSNGEDILWVSNMLGHKHSSMTLDMYARYIRQKNRERATFLKDAS